MEIVTIGPKYQVVIPKKVRDKLKIKKGDKIAIGASDEKTATIITNPKSWTDRTYGLMKEAWKDIDTTKYLKKIKNEWDRTY